ncbi:MAG: YARHG domain-containing protein [Clostridiales bacterium]|nr:YARHG domain-containing protein [Clostridiales bacterium]
MNCPYCGKEIPGDSRFCTECGAQLSAEPPKMAYSSSQTAQTPKRELTPEEALQVKKRNRIILAAGGAVLAILIVIGLAVLLIKPSINLNKYLTVSAEGYDTVGTAVVTFDRDQFEADYEKKLSSKVGRKSSGSASSRFLNDCVDGMIDREDHLSNGDVITYEWFCDDDCALEDYGYKLKYKDVEYTVSGLEEAELFDAFDGIEVVFEGISPDGSASIEGSATAAAAKDLYYELDRRKDLANGDTVTVTASGRYTNDTIQYCIENYGMIPSSLTKEYTVTGLPVYLSALSDIPEESLAAMQSQARDVYLAHMAKNWGEGETLKSFTYMGAYLLTNKNSGSYRGNENILYLVYQVQVANSYVNGSSAYQATNNVYWYISFSDLLLSSDGTVTVDLTSYKTPGDRMEIDSGVSSGWFSTKKWQYYGYRTLADLYRVAVTSNLETYNHEDQIDESAALAAEDASHLFADLDEEGATSGEAGIIFPNSSTERISEAAVRALSDEDLRYAINELYARHGYIFKDDELRAYYEKYSWYNKTVRPENFSENLFNSIEKENMKILLKERERR